VGLEHPVIKTLRRCGQVNFNERDPQALNIADWVDYWSSLKLDALLLDAGGIMPKAAKQKCMRVVARLDCNYRGLKPCSTKRQTLLAGC
jgi:hypothetical protein